VHHKQILIRFRKLSIVIVGNFMASKNFQPLFKGERTWKVWVEDRGSNGVFLLCSYGLVGKKQVLSENEITKKDAFPSTWDRAIVEAQSLWKSQREKGYDVMDDEDKQPSKVLPMLAHDFEKQGSKLPDEVIFQPKLDGVRLLVGNVGSEDAEVLQSTSRSGKPLSVPHVVKALQGILDPGEFLDGEIFLEGEAFEIICGKVREDSADSKLGLSYHVFDTFTLNVAEPFHERYARLSKLFEAGLAPCLKLVETTSGAKKDAQRMLTHYIERGQEGAILRDPKAPYMVDKRSIGLQKLKAFLSKEYEIVAAEEGNGREAGAVVWVCTTGVGGSLFKARPLGPDRGTQKALQGASSAHWQAAYRQVPRADSPGSPSVPCWNFRERL
jgi:ATP-dependent DNA ligase